MMNKSGFTAVEVMIALFVASLFLFAGYQLFSITIQNHLLNRVRSEASNIAHNHLRIWSMELRRVGTTWSTAGYESDVTGFFGPEPIPGARVRLAVTFSYNQSHAHKVIRLQVTVTYSVEGVPQKESQAIYVYN